MSYFCTDTCTVGTVGMDCGSDCRDGVHAIADASPAIHEDKNIHRRNERQDVQDGKNRSSNMNGRKFELSTVARQLVVL